MAADKLAGKLSAKAKSSTSSTTTSSTSSTTTGENTTGGNTGATTGLFSQITSKLDQLKQSVASILTGGTNPSTPNTGTPGTGTPNTGTNPTTSIITSLIQKIKVAISQPIKTPGTPNTGTSGTTKTNPTDFWTGVRQSYPSKFSSPGFQTYFEGLNPGKTSATNPNEKDNEKIFNDLTSKINKLMTSNILKNPLKPAPVKSPAEGANPGNTQSGNNGKNNQTGGTKKAGKTTSLLESLKTQTQTQNPGKPNTTSSQSTTPAQTQIPDKKQEVLDIMKKQQQQSGKKGPGLLNNPQGNYDPNSLHSKINPNGDGTDTVIVWTDKWIHGFNEATGQSKHSNLKTNEHMPELDESQDKMKKYFEEMQKTLGIEFASDKEIEEGFKKIHVVSDEDFNKFYKELNPNKSEEYIESVQGFYDPKTGDRFIKESAFNEYPETAIHEVLHGLGKFPLNPYNDGGFTLDHTLNEGTTQYLAQLIFGSQQEKSGYKAEVAFVNALSKFLAAEGYPNLVEMGYFGGEEGMYTLETIIDSYYYAEAYLNPEREDAKSLTETTVNISMFVNNPSEDSVKKVADDWKTLVSGKESLHKLEAEDPDNWGSYLHDYYSQLINFMKG